MQGLDASMRTQRADGRTQGRTHTHSSTQRRLAQVPADLRYNLVPAAYLYP